MWTGQRMRYHPWGQWFAWAGIWSWKMKEPHPWCSGTTGLEMSTGEKGCPWSIHTQVALDMESQKGKAEESYLKSLVTMWTKQENPRTIRPEVELERIHKCSKEKKPHHEFRDVTWQGYVNGAKGRNTAPPVQWFHGRDVAGQNQHVQNSGVVLFLGWWHEQDWGRCDQGSGTSAHWNQMGMGDPMPVCMNRACKRCKELAHSTSVQLCNWFQNVNRVRGTIWCNQGTSWVERESWRRSSSTSIQLCEWTGSVSRAKKHDLPSSLCLATGQKSRRHEHTHTITATVSLGLACSHQRRGSTHQCGGRPIPEVWIQEHRLSVPCETGERMWTHTKEKPSHIRALE